MLHMLMSFTLACLIYIVFAFLYSQTVGKENSIQIGLSAVFAWKVMVVSLILSLIVSVL